MEDMTLPIGDENAGDPADTAAAIPDAVAAAAGSPHTVQDAPAGAQPTPEEETDEQWRLRCIERFRAGWNSQRLGKRDKQGIWSDSTLVERALGRTPACKSGVDSTSVKRRYRCARSEWLAIPDALFLPVTEKRPPCSVVGFTLLSRLFTLFRN